MTHRPDPLVLYQFTLDVLSRAVMVGDVEAARRWIRLPWPVITLTAKFIVDTDEALVAGILAYAQTLRLQGVTDYIRIAKKAYYLDDISIEGHHVTHTLRGSVPVVPPYDNRMVLQLDQGDWRVTLADHAMTNDRWPIRWITLAPPDTPERNT